MDPEWTPEPTSTPKPTPTPEPKAFGAGDAWRVKVVAGWALLAPVGAMVLVVAISGSGSANQVVVDSRAIAQPRLDSVFDSLANDVPNLPGVDGSIGTEKRSSIEVPITGTTDGKPHPPGTPVGPNAAGIPGTVLAAYQKAANDVTAANPGCGITWPLPAGIGKVESSHASGGRVDAAGNTRGQILGPVLDGGPGMAAISDTDQGQYDGNAQWDRAVGPMQFIPGSWTAFGADGNGDGLKNPHNVFDAARAAAEYLCSGGSNLRDPQGLVQAVLRYNHSMDYVSTVLRWMQTYSQSTLTLPNGDGVIPPASDDGNVKRGGDPEQEITPTPGLTPTPMSTLPTLAQTPVPTQAPGTTRPTVVPPGMVLTTPTPSTKPPWLPPSTPQPTATKPSPTLNPETPASQETTP